MNIFYLSREPDTAAAFHCDKHVVKMCVEYAQILSTAHRVLDGELIQSTNPETGKMKSLLLLQGETASWKYVENGKDEITKEPILKLKFTIDDPICYSATHVNHPSTVWARTSKYNYIELRAIWTSLLYEYSRRYGKTHAASKLSTFIQTLPTNITEGVYTDPPCAMDPQYIVSQDAVENYRNYYIKDKSRFAVWKNQETPYWFK